MEREKEGKKLVKHEKEEELNKDVKNKNKD